MSGVGGKKRSPSKPCARALVGIAIVMAHASAAIAGRYFMEFSREKASRHNGARPLIDFVDRVRQACLCCPGRTAMRCGR